MTQTQKQIFKLLRKDTNNVWYLGIDFGTTGISAVLCKPKTGEQYPIAWEFENQQGAKESSFRLPAVAYSGPTATATEPLGGTGAIAVGSAVSPQAFTQPGIFLKHFKPYLNLGIPYYVPNQQRWEPSLQWSNQQQVPLYWVQKALQTLLTTLKPGGVEVPRPYVTGWSEETLSGVLKQLRGVVLGCPAGWGDAYRFNLREAVLGAQLVQRSEQIFVIEDAIATVLASLPIHKQADSPDSPPSLALGTTLVINAGATTTELALVKLPDNLSDLSYRDFSFLSFAYAGNAIDQDIICQLLLKDEAFQALDSASTAGDLQSLKDLPLAGEPDLEARYRLQQQLQDSKLGHAVLEAAGYLKLILQQQDEYTLNLGNYRWVLRRQDLERQVLMPFIQHLNQSVNKLLSQTGLLGQGVEQVICTGGTAGWKILQDWLQQKLPHAAFIQDTHLPRENDAISGFLRVATGLASLPFYPQVLDQPQQQYSNYFLLLELLRSFPEKSLRVAELMLLLEHRGINTRACYPRLIKLLEDQLPSGLVLSEPESQWLTPDSQQNTLMQAIATEPLFYKEDSEMYRPNPEQAERLRQYLSTLFSDSAQKLEEPLIVNF